LSEHSRSPTIVLRAPRRSNGRSTSPPEAARLGRIECLKYPLQRRPAGQNRFAYRNENALRLRLGVDHASGRRAARAPNSGPLAPFPKRYNSIHRIIRSRRSAKVQERKARRTRLPTPPPPDALRRSICRYALLLPALPLAARARAQTSEPVDPRTGNVRINVSIATKAMTKLVNGLNQHLPRLKIGVRRAGAIDTGKPRVAEREAGLMSAGLVHSADPGGFDYFAQKGWIDRSLAELPLVKDYRDGFYATDAGWVALRATGIAIMYNSENVKASELPRSWKE